jgi:serine/threonine protein kinase/tetratricopeptide (TPR) repeat protein
MDLTDDNHPSLEPALILLAIRCQVIDAALVQEIWQAEPWDGKSFWKRLVAKAEISADQESALVALANAQRSRHRSADFETAMADETDNEDLRRILASVTTVPVEETVASGTRSDVRKEKQHSRANERFRLGDELGRGGLGCVSAAMDLELGRRVAVKQIRHEYAFDSAYRRKFDFEARLTGNLEHPGIVPVYAYGQQSDGQMYYAMRRVEGKSLDDLIRDFHQRRLAGQTDFASSEFRQLLGRLIGVAQAVQYAHSRNVIHRDLKPANVMVGQFGETILLDWGLAKQLANSDTSALNAKLKQPASTPQTQDESTNHTGDQIETRRRSVSNSEDMQLDTDPLATDPFATRPAGSSGVDAPVMAGADAEPTAQGQGLGTPGFASPEQLAGQWDKLSPAADIYCLGGMLYQLLTNRPPNTGRSTEELKSRVLAGMITPPREIEATAPKALAAIAMRALEVEPSNRYGQVSQWIEDIEHWLADEPVSAMKDSLVARGGRWLRHHKSMAATALAGIVIVAIVASVSAIVVNQQRIENQKLAIANGALAIQEAASRQSAETRRQQAEAVTDFLVDMFASADPSTEGREIKVAQVLDGAVQRLVSTEAASIDDEDRDSALAAETDAEDRAQLTPQAKQSVLFAIARTYLGLGLYAEGIESIEAGLALSKLVPEAIDAATEFDGWNLAGRLYLQASQLENADEAFQRAIALAESSPEIPATKSFSARSNYVEFLRKIGRIREAIPLAESLRDEAELNSGTESVETISIRSILALLYADNGRLDEALPLIEQNIEILRTILPDDSPRMLVERNNLGSTLRKLGEYTRAIDVLTDVLNYKRQVLGEAHGSTIGTINNLAMALREAGRGDESYRLMKEAHAVCLETYGEDSMMTMTLTNNLAYETMQEKRLPEAKDLFAESLRLRSENLPAQHPLVLEAHNNMAFIHELLGENKESLEQYKIALKGQLEVFPPGHPRTVDTIDNIIRLLEEDSSAPDESSRFREIRQRYLDGETIEL